MAPSKYVSRSRSVKRPGSRRCSSCRRGRSKSSSQSILSKSRSRSVVRDRGGREERSNCKAGAFSRGRSRSSRRASLPGASDKGRASGARSRARSRAPKCRASARKSRIQSGTGRNTSARSRSAVRRRTTCGKSRRASGKRGTGGASDKTKPNKPKPKMRAFNYFIKEQFAGHSVGDSKVFMKTIAERWKKMSLAEKDRYKNEAENCSNENSGSGKKGDEKKASKSTDS